MKSYFIKKSFPFTLSIIFTFISLQCTFSQSIDDIIRTLELQNRSVNTLAYSVKYKNVFPVDKDSLFISQGNVWLNRVRSDSIFGSHFHTSGINNGGAYDYYYYGKTCFEARHKDKKLVIIDPYEFPNDVNNPAKARTALRIYLRLLTDDSLYSTLFKGNPRTEIHQINNTSEITFYYPPNEYGQVLTRKIFVNKQIHKIEEEVLWNGIKSTTSIEIDNYKVNDPEIVKNIPLTKDYADYTKEFRKPERKEIFISPLMGNLAPPFTYNSFNGEKISLNDFRGRIIFLDFWETWCGHCIINLPRVNGLKEKYKGLQIFGIVTENQDKVDNLIKINKVKYTNLVADSTILKDYRVSSGRPKYVLIDKKGIVVFDSDSSGADLDKVALKIDELLKQ